MKTYIKSDLQRKSTFGWNVKKNKISSYFVGRIYFGIEDLMIDIKSSKSMVAMITADKVFWSKWAPQTLKNVHV